MTLEPLGVPVSTASLYIVEWTGCFECSNGQGAMGQKDAKGTIIGGKELVEQLLSIVYNNPQNLYIEDNSSSIFLIFLG